MVTHALDNVSDSSKRVTFIPSHKSTGNGSNDFFKQLIESKEKQGLSQEQQKLRLEMNRVFSSWMRKVLELNPNLEFEIYLSDGSVGVRSFFYSQENLGKTLELCEEGLKQIYAIEGLSPLLRYFRHSLSGAINNGYVTASATAKGETSYFFPQNMPPEGSEEYALKLTEAKIAQPGWLSDIWGGIVQADYVEKLEEIKQAKGDEIEHMEKCFAALPGALKRLGAAVSAREAKYEDVSAVDEATRFLCHSLIDMKMEISGQADSKASQLVSYLKAKLYDSGKLFELFNSALLEGAPKLEKGELEAWVSEKKNRLYYLDTYWLVSKNTIFRKHSDELKVRLLAHCAGQIFELSNLFSEE